MACHLINFAASAVSFVSFPVHGTFSLEDWTRSPIADKWNFCEKKSTCALIDSVLTCTPTRLVSVGTPQGGEVDLSRKCLLYRREWASNSGVQVSTSSAKLLMVFSYMRRCQVPGTVGRVFWWLVVDWYVIRVAGGVWLYLWHVGCATR